MAVENLVAELRLEINQFRQQMTRAQRLTNDNTRRMEQGISRVDRGFRGLSGTVRTFGAVLAATGIGLFVREAVQASNQMVALDNAFRTITGSAKASQQTLQFLRQEAQRLGLDFIQSAKSFQGLAASARGTALEGEGARKVFVAVAQASRVLGLSSEQTGGALTALQQIMSKGTVQAEELRGQLGERIPGAFQIAARAMGVTTAELGKMLEQGQVLAEDFLPKFAAQLDKEFAGGVARAGATFQAETTRMGNAIKDFLVEAGDLITQNPKVIEAVKDAAESFKLLAQAIHDARGPLGQIVGFFAQIASGLFRAAVAEIQLTAESLKDASKESQTFGERIANIARLITQFIPLGELFTPRPVGETTEELRKFSILFNSVTERMQQFSETELEDVLRLDAEDLKRTQGEIEKLAQKLKSLPKLDIGEPKKIRDEIALLQEALAKRVELGLDPQQVEIIRTRILELRDSYNELTETLEQKIASGQLEAFGGAMADLEGDIEDGIDAAQEFIEQQFELAKQSEKDITKRRELLKKFLDDLERAGVAYRELSDIALRENKKITDDLERQNERRKRDTERALKEQQRAYEQFAGRVEDRIGNVFEAALRGKISDAGEFFRDTFFSAIAQIAARALTTQLVMPAVMSFGGGGIGSFSATGGGAIPGTAQSSPTATALRTGGSLFTGIGNQGGVLAPLSGPSPNYGAFATGVAGSAAAGFAGYSTGTAIGQQFGLGNTQSERIGQQVGAGVLGTVGAVFAGPAGASIGAAIGSLIGGAVGSLFGGPSNASFELEAVRSQGTDGFFRQQRQLFNDARIGTGFTFGDRGLEFGGFSFVFDEDRIGKQAGNDLLDAIELQIDTVLGGFADTVSTFERPVQEQFKSELDKLAVKMASELQGVEFDGSHLQEEAERFLGQTLPELLGKTFDEIGRAIQQRAIINEAVAGIDAQITALIEAMQTPAEIFEKRLDQIQALQGQLIGAGFEEALQIAPQIQQLVGQAFALAPSTEVLGQDRLAMMTAQDSLIDVLRDLSGTLMDIPSFQGITQPVTFSQPTLAAVHSGETLLPAGGGGGVTLQNGAIVINAAPTQSARDIATDVVREIERLGQFGQTRIMTQRR